MTQFTLYPTSMFSNLPSSVSSSCCQRNINHWPTCIQTTIMKLISDCLIWDPSFCCQKKAVLEFVSRWFLRLDELLPVIVCYNSTRKTLFWLTSNMPCFLEWSPYLWNDTSCHCYCVLYTYLSLHGFQSSNNTPIHGQQVDHIIVTFSNLFFSKQKLKSWLEITKNSSFCEITFSVIMSNF